MPVLQATDQQFPFVNHLGREVIVQYKEQLFMSYHFFAPGFPVDPEIFEGRDKLKLSY